MSTHPQSTTCTETCGPQTDREEGISREILPSVTNEDRSASEADQAYDQACYDLQRGNYVAQMGHKSRFPVAPIVWCRFGG